MENDQDEEEEEEFGQEHDFESLRKYETIRASLEGNRKIYFNPIDWYKRRGGRKNKDRELELWKKSLDLKTQNPGEDKNDIIFGLKNCHTSALSRVVRNFYSRSFGFICKHCKKEQKGVSIVQPEETNCCTENDEEFCSETRFKTTSYFANRNIDFLKILGDDLESFVGDSFIDFQKNIDNIKKDIKFGEIDLSKIYMNCSNAQKSLNMNNRHYYLYRRQIQGN